MATARPVPSEATLASRLPSSPSSAASVGADYAQGDLVVTGLLERRVPWLMAAVHQRRGNDEVRGRPVAGHRDVADDRDPQQGLDVGVMRLWLQRIPEEDQQVDLALGDPGADLLVTTVRAAAEAGNRESELLLQQVTGRGGREQLVTGQQVQVVFRPFEHVALLIVVRDQGDPSPGGRRPVECHVNPLGAFSRS